MVVIVVGVDDDSDGAIGWVGEECECAEVKRE